MCGKVRQRNHVLVCDISYLNATRDDNNERIDEIDTEDYELP